MTAWRPKQPIAVNYIEKDIFISTIYDVNQFLKMARNCLQENHQNKEINNRYSVGLRRGVIFFMLRNCYF